MPQSLTTPNCGLSMISQTNVTATTGATYGSSTEARTKVRPRKRPRSASAATRPKMIESTVPPTV